MADIPELTPVSSRNLSGYGYVAEDRELFIEFISGGVYCYFSVPLEEVTAMIGAPSMGEYFARNIKGTYAYQRVG